MSREPVYPHMCLSKVTPVSYKGDQAGNAGKKVLRALRQIGRQLGENAARPPMSLFLSPLESVNFPKTLPHLLPLSWFVRRLSGRMRFL